MHLPPLPIDAVLEEVVGTVTAGGNLVLEAPPGTGKTTRVPLALWRAGLANEGDIVVLQPRRLATRMAATFVASQLGEEVGYSCGYQVRFEHRVGPHTKLRFVTEGVLNRMLRTNPTLAGTSVVVFDEFHERHLDGDMSLALLRRLQHHERPDLRLLAMSATLESDTLATFLDARVVRAVQPTFPVAIEYAPADDRPLERRVLRALADLSLGSVEGHVLVFLPGTREIRMCEQACAPIAEANGFVIAPLCGELSSAQQDAAVRGPATQRLILATNVAETSITIDGVAVVVDSGLCRQASYDAWSGLPRLELAKVSRASATQRTGRAGRTRVGRCVRLYSQVDHDQRPAQTAPEIARLDLSGVALDLAAAGIEDLDAFTWFERPRASSLQSASKLLHDLSALEAGRLTPTGAAMLKFPVHPRVARFLVACQERGVARHGAKVAAVISEGGPPPPGTQADTDADADAFELVERIWSARDQASRTAPSMRGSEVIRRAASQIDRLLRHDSGSEPALDRDQREHELRLALLVAFPDRVCTIRDDTPTQRTCVFATGGSAVLSPASVVRSATWAVALGVSEVRVERGRSFSQVWSACAIEPEWLVDLFPHAITDDTTIGFDRDRQRVFARSQLNYGSLCIESSELSRLPPDATRLLVREALASDPSRFCRDPSAFAALRARLRFARSHDEPLPELTDERVADTLTEMASECTSFAELTRADLLAHVELAIGHPSMALLDAVAPRHVSLAGGRRLEVHYELDRPPWVQSRLQDFFGLARGPTVARGEVALVLHLLAPNQRAVQVTTDLAGFWERHYPTLRKQLSRRYPKHAWPEDPLHASPPSPRRR